MQVAILRVSLIGTLLCAALGCGSTGDGPDAAAGDAEIVAPGPPTLESCFGSGSAGARTFGPDYARYDPVLGSHCLGTNHQDIEGIERLVFLGDSVTVGTPPTPMQDHYRSKFTERMRERFGSELIVDNCSRNGSRTDDFLQGSEAQLPQCFAEGENAGTTLVVWTMGGNDISNWASNALTSQDALLAVDEAAALLDDAVAWLKQPGRFPDGVFIIFANPYEFTDATGDLQACPAASIAIGGTTNWIEGEQAVLRFQERYMEVAVSYGVDMIFTLERFCGHGYRRDDPEGRCYQGPDAELWFDVTCIHPNSAGHAELTDMFTAVVEE